MPHDTIDSDIVTPAQAAKIKGVSRTAIYNALADGRLQGVRVLGRIGVDRSALKAWQPQARVGRPQGKPMNEEQKATIAKAQKKRWAQRKAHQTH
ncbi:MAG TPA: helix-turn-helix domain-containing protein [Abditibacteriaceae bacterium]